MVNFPEAVQKMLQDVRAAIQTAVPDAEEAISYQMPTFKLKGNVVSFAAYQNHIGLYPAPNGIEAFAEELAPYKSGKGTAQFLLDQPLPLDLIGRIARFRADENLAKAAAKAKKKK
jgi:uncharacterized protein YdhG (YjbR/CyaY superfamily)